MRALPLLFVFLASCHAQSDEAKVASAVKQLEHAQQTGDFQAYLNLFAKDKRGDLEKLRPYARPQPQTQYRASKIRVQGNEAGVLVQGADADSFVIMTYVKEDGEWRIADQLFRNTAASPDFLYALIPPAFGAFSRDGFRWDRAAPGVDPAAAVKLGWNLRAVFDEAYLYLRIESNSDLPAPNSTIEKSPGNWPVLKINVVGGSDYTLLDALNIGDQATFGLDGKANSHRAFAAYSMRLEKNDKEVFTAPVGLHPERLLEVTGRNLDMRIPLQAIGITDSRSAKITVGDAQWPKSALVSIDVRRYPN